MADDISGTHNLDVQEYTRQLYERVGHYWESKKGHYSTWDHSFRILYSPPQLKPDLMIIGFNPGGDASKASLRERQGWPLIHDYVQFQYPLAKKINDLFASIESLDSLHRSVKTNIVFFRTPTTKRKKDQPEKKAWCHDVPKRLRKELEAFCGREVRCMISMFSPRLILTEGFEAFKILSTGQIREIRSEKQSTNNKHRVIAKIGTIGPIPIIGLLHPTGARVANDDWRLVMATVKELL